MTQPFHSLMCSSGVDIFEIPPNGQGLTALLALNILEGVDMSKMEYHKADHLHLLVEAMRLAFRYFASQ